MDLNTLNIKINEAGVALSDASAALSQNHVADCAAALDRVSHALVAIQQMHDADANNGGPPPANIPPPQQAGDSWSQWTGPIPVTSLDRADLSFAQIVETTIIPGSGNRTYGSLFWLDKIGGTEDQVRAWRQLGADPRFDEVPYIAADPRGLVAAARNAGVAI